MLIPWQNPIPFLPYGVKKQIAILLLYITINILRCLTDEILLFLVTVSNVLKHV